LRQHQLMAVAKLCFN